MSERDKSRDLAVGAGAPADPDPTAAGPAVPFADGGPVGAVDPAATPDAYGQQPSPGDVVQAVADFVEDLVDDVGTGESDGA